MQTEGLPDARRRKEEGTVPSLMGSLCSGGRGQASG